MKLENSILKDLAIRKVLFGKPLSGKSFQYGLFKIFSDLGFESFLLKMPKLCYPNLVKAFYSSLHVDISGYYVSTFSNVMITLSLLFLSVIIKIHNPSSLYIHNKRDRKFLDGFSALDN